MNLSGLLDVFDGIELIDEVIAGANSADSSELTPLHLLRAARAPFLAKLHQQRQQPTLLIVGRTETATLWQQAIETWLPPGVSTLRFPEPTPLPYERAPWSAETRLSRMTVLTRLMAGQHPLLPAQKNPPLIVTSARALLHKTLPKRALLTTLKILKIGQIIDIDKTLSSWEEIGYERVPLVEKVCQFSQRGGIIDIFAPSAPYPVRIELFGDEVDTLRYFDPASQRSVAGDVQRIVVPPAREALPKLAVRAGERLSAESIPKEDDFPAWQDDIDELLTGKPFPYIEYYLPMLFPRAASLIDYLPDGTSVIVDDWAELGVAVRDLQGRAAQLRGQQPNLPELYPSPLHNWDDLAAKLTGRAPLVLGELVEEPQPAPEDAPLELADLFNIGARHGGQERPFLTQLQRSLDLEQRTVVVSRQAQRLADLWKAHAQKGGDSWVTNHQISRNNFGKYLPLSNMPQLPEDGTLTFVTGTLDEGFILDNGSGVLLQLITDAEIFGWNRPAPKRRRVQKAVAPENYFADFEPGDHIVHIEYGIGRFEGMVTRTIGGTLREYLQISYANNDRLYIPIHHADRLSKWIGGESNKPTLTRVGEKRWRQAKASAQKSVNDMADELLDLYAQRESIAGHAFAADAPWQYELEASFPFQETDDQLKAITDVKSDMEKPYPMDRLICGDVGFGKTEVALRAAFKAVMDGKQVAILVPTTVLAQQHYNTFTERLNAFPVEVALLSRFQTAKQAHTIIQNMRESRVDIVVGTHRLLSDDISFKDLGLLIIDEEQRFGVSHKEKLKQLRTEVDVLTLTATPIPRTLYMGLSGLRDISTITTPPQERLPVQTYVGQANDELVKRAIMREMDRSGQIFFVHNRVETIHAAAKVLSVLAPKARIGIGHGQLTELQLEKVMRQFAAHEIDILVCTTIVESGLDIPNANTLIVDKAQNFGLAQLYQLRGRVGRSTRRAYAYFFHSNWRSLTPEARARLETLDEHQELGSGYSIAMRDLEIRGAGELLGDGQSGHISSVGFDLYTRMLARAVRARKSAKDGKGPTISAEIPDAISIDLPMAAYIPTDYVPDAPLRLRLYRRLAAMDELDEIGEVANELAERFGGLPDPVSNLLYQLRVKIFAGRAGITSIFTEGGQVRIKMDLEQIDRWSLQKFLGDSQRVSKTAIWLTPDLPTNVLRVRLVQILERLAQFNELQASKSA